MMRAVFDTNLLVSAFLMRHHPGGVSTELLRFVHDGTVELYLSPEIIQETAGTLARSGRAQARYRYTPEQAMQYCADLFTVATIITNPTPLVGAVPRDPDDDKIVACAVSAKAEYLVTRDQDLLSLGSYGEVAMITPEQFLTRVRAVHPPS
jgi:putative PIN family toxin of toxin-antitoxin system